MRGLAAVIYDRSIALGTRSLAAGAPWNGEQYTTTDGKQISVYTSSSYGNDPSVRQSWVPFISWMPHGDEMQGLAVYMAPLFQVTQICGSGAVGCYSYTNNTLVMPGDRNEVSMEQVLAHEYGHRIAHFRRNDPWDASHYGPKHWATYAGVCQRVQQGSAYPGDEGVNYQINPGEAFADTYRLWLQQSYNATPDATWFKPGGSMPFLTPSFPNDSVAYSEIQMDVTDPWTGPTSEPWGGALQPPLITKRVKKIVKLQGKKHTKWVTIRVRSGTPKPVRRVIETPLDGVLIAAIQAAPPGASLSIYDEGGGTIIGPAGVQNMTFTVCGQRHVMLVLSGSTPGSFRVSIET
jgi:hypothetical protein